MHPNPYEPPQTGAEPLANCVDRQQRDELAVAVRCFLAEDLTAFDFDERLDAFRDSADTAVRFVTQAVWFHYDDCRDHLVTLSKPEWDYFQRLLLLLECDAGVQTTTSRRWSLTQVAAFIALLSFGWLGFQLGWGTQLLVAAIPFGIVSICISLFCRKTIQPGPYDRIFFPFATFSDLKFAYESVAFKKSRYPRHIQSRRIRSPIMNAVIQLQFYVIWLILSPFALLFQMLPERETNTRVVAA